MILETDVVFGARTTYRVGGRASRSVEISSIEDLHDLAGMIDSSTEIYVLGRGSNTLVADAGFNGVVVHLSEEFGEIQFPDPGSHTMVAGGAVDLPIAARRSVEAGLTGFEWAVGVPGSIGGAVRMNAGGHGSDMAASVTTIEIFDLDRGEVRILGPEEAGFGYRSSSIGSRHVVLAASLKLGPGDVERGREEIREIVRWRREHQPGGANCGSVFTNPTGDSAGRLIEAAGLKGLRHGSAHVSEKHANFIQADAGGLADDVAALMATVAAAVSTLEGVDLVSEVRMVGFDVGEI